MQIAKVEMNLTPIAAYQYCVFGDLYKGCLYQKQMLDALNYDAMGNGLIDSLSCHFKKQRIKINTIFENTLNPKT